MRFDWVESVGRECVSLVGKFSRFGDSISNVARFGIWWVTDKSKSSLMLAILDSNKVKTAKLNGL